MRTRRQGSTVVYDSQKALSFTLGGSGGGTDAGGGTSAVCKPINVSISPASPQTVGTPVDVTGSATCTNSGTPEFQYYYLPPGGLWTLGRNYAAAGLWTWNTTGKAVGAYTILSRSRAQGSTVLYDDQKSSPYTLQ